MKDKIKMLKLAEKIDNIYSGMNEEICSNCQNYDKTEQDKYLNRGCCGNCARAGGYFESNWRRKDNNWVFKKSYLKLRQKYHFNKKYGFFDVKNMRCGLPRVERSYVCLGALCDETEEYLNKKYGKKFNTHLLVEKLIELKRKNGLLI
jgi:hypothetical protein